MKDQLPISNDQRMTNAQALMPHRFARFGFRHWRIGASLVIGHWELVISPPPHSTPLTTHQKFAILKVTD